MTDSFKAVRALIDAARGSDGYPEDGPYYLAQRAKEAELEIDAYPEPVKDVKDKALAKLSLIERKVLGL